MGNPEANAVWTVHGWKAYCYLTATSWLTCFWYHVSWCKLECVVHITTGSCQTFGYNREPWLHLSSRILCPFSDRPYSQASSVSDFYSDCTLTTRPVFDRIPRFFFILVALSCKIQQMYAADSVRPTYSMRWRLNLCPFCGESGRKYCLKYKWKTYELPPVFLKTVTVGFTFQGDGLGSWNGRWNREIEPELLELKSAMNLFNCEIWKEIRNDHSSIWFPCWNYRFPNLYKSILR